jgi:hypothetical protein
MMTDLLKMHHFMKKSFAVRVLLKLSGAIHSRFIHNFAASK